MIEEEFLGKLAKLVEEAKEKNNLIDFKKLDAFCKEQKLTGEQMDLVYQYFEDNKIEVAASTEVDSDVSAGKDGSAADGELVLEPTDEELEEEEEDKIDLHSIDLLYGVGTEDTVRMYLQLEYSRRKAKEKNNE